MGEKKPDGRLESEHTEGLLLILLYLYIIYIIIYIIYNIELSSATLSYDFTKCTCVPAFALPRKMSVFEWYGRIWWIVYENFAEIAELSYRLLGNISRIVGWIVLSWVIFIYK